MLVDPSAVVLTVAASRRYRSQAWPHHSGGEKRGIISQKVGLISGDEAFAEALLELRFISNDVPEVLLGHLASNLPHGMVTERLPLADFPAPIRRGDPNLAHQPILQLASNDRRRLARIGEQV